MRHIPTREGRNPRDASRPVKGPEQKEQALHPLTLWSWSTQEEQQPPLHQDRTPPPTEQRAPDEGGVIDWSSAIYRLQEAVRDAHRSLGHTENGCQEDLVNALPSDRSFGHLVKAVTFRVQALAKQLKPQGAISFAPLHTFSSTAATCGLCGEKLRPSQHFVCMPCAIAKHLALGTFSVSAWLHFILSPEEASAADEYGWTCLLSSSYEERRMPQGNDGGEERG